MGVFVGVFVDIFPGIWQGRIVVFGLVFEKGDACPPLARSSDLQAKALAIDLRRDNLLPLIGEAGRHVLGGFALVEQYLEDFA